MANLLYILVTDPFPLLLFVVGAIGLYYTIRWRMTQ